MYSQDARFTVRSKGAPLFIEGLYKTSFTVSKILLINFPKFYLRVYKTGIIQSDFLASEKSLHFLKVCDLFLPYLKVCTSFLYGVLCGTWLGDGNEEWAPTD